MGGARYARSGTTSPPSTVRCRWPRWRSTWRIWRRSVSSTAERAEMLREKLVERHAAPPHEVRWRSREISRLEGLSDAVFGFAITLLIVALEVPRTSGELLETMRGFISFGLTFTLLYSL